MPTAREQVEAYNHEVRRQAMALLQGDEPAPVDPRRRLNRALIGGVVVGVLALAISGVVGLLAGKGQTSLPDSGTVLVSGTGDRYVVVDKVLHPALNLASAVLLGGSKITTVAPSALDGVARGLPVGIPGAPDALPAPEDLTRSAWDVCSTAAQARDARDQVAVAVGGTAAPTAALGPDQAVVLTSRAAATGGSGTASTVTWLVQGGQRYQVGPAALALLGLERVAPTEVGPQVLDLLPAGPPLEVPSVPGAGATPSVSLPFDAKVGDLVTTGTAGTAGTSYVVLDRGLAPLDPFAAVLLAGGSARTVRVTPDVVSRVTADVRPPTPAGWPQRVPDLAAIPPARPLCLHYQPGTTSGTGAPRAVTVSTPGTVAVPAGLSAVAPASGSLPTVATALAVRSGTGTLVRATSSSGVDGSYRLLLDSGLQFPVADADAVTRLGYDPSRAVDVPAAFLDLVPSGPALSPTAAAREYGGGTVRLSPSSTTGGSVSVAPGG